MAPFPFTFRTASISSSTTRVDRLTLPVVCLSALLAMSPAGCGIKTSGPPNDAAVRAAAVLAAGRAEPSPGDISIDGVSVEGTSAIVRASGTVVDAQDIVWSATRLGRALDEAVFSSTGCERVTLYWGSGGDYYVRVTHTARTFSRSGVVFGFLRPNADSLRYFQTAEEYRWLELSDWDAATSPEGGFSKGELPKAK